MHAAILLHLSVIANHKSVAVRAKIRELRLPRRPDSPRERRPRGLAEVADKRPWRFRPKRLFDIQAAAVATPASAQEANRHRDAIAGMAKQDAHIRYRWTGSSTRDGE